MLTLLALVSTAIAGDDPLADEIRALQEELGGPVLLCVAGEDAEQATRRTLQDIGQEDLPIIRVPTAGDIEAEMTRALEQGGVACGLRIAPTQGGFDLSRHGDCRGVAAGTEPDPVQAPTDTTGPDAAPAAPPTEAEWATREARYRRDRLMLVDLPPDPTLPDGVSWEVVDGRGSSLSTRTLATIAQDEDLGLELDRELKRSRTASKVMFWTGVGLALLSPVPLVGVEGGAISENQDRAWSTVFLLASGGLTMSLSASPRKAARSRQQHPALYMEGDMAEDVVVVHNHRLYGSLELDQRPPPDEDAADDAAEGGAAEGAPDTAPEGDAPEGGAAEGDAAEGDAAEGDAAEGDAAEGAEAPTEGDAAGGDAAEGEMDAAEVDANEAAEAPAPPEDGSDGAPPDALEPGEPSPGTTPNAPAESQPTDGGEGAASDR